MFVFNVLYKIDGKTQTVTVFNVRCNKNGYPHFLIYMDKQWKYVSAKHCIPI